MMNETKIEIPEDAVWGWHFCIINNGTFETKKSGEIVTTGKLFVLPADQQVELCKSGYHASERPLDALFYAAGSGLSRVAVWGDVDKGSNKFVGRYRYHEWVMDATDLLHEFACRAAEYALSFVDNPDPRSIAAIAAKRAWLRGEIGNDELATARDAAWAAAWAAAWDAAMAAAAGRTAAWVHLNGLLLDLINDATPQPGGGEERE